MKRRMTLISMFLISMFFLTGCTKNKVFDQNKVIPPKPNSISINGIWKPISYEVIDEAAVEEGQQDNFMNELVTISEDSVSIEDNIIENPKFKLKRLNKNEYISGSNKITSKYDLKDKEYVDIISVSDNNKTYFNIILADNNKAILFKSSLYSPTVVAELIKKSSSANNSEEDSDEVKSSDNLNKIIDSQDKYYKMDAGILLGLKTLGKKNSSGELILPQYKTLWISMNGDTIQPIKELNNMLLLPRTNGFSKIQLESKNYNWGHEEVLKVINKKKGEKEIKSTLVQDNGYNDITFIGNDYIGLQYYNGKDFNNKYNKYKIIPVDSLNTSESVDITNLLGEKGKVIYENSKMKFLEANKLENSKKFDLNNNYKNVTLVRKNGQWQLESLINCKSGDETMAFLINISPVNTFVNYDTMLIPWNKVIDFNPSTRDLVSSPNSKFAVALIEDRLVIYKIINGKIKNELANIKINSNDEIVMAEWATGDFVNYWNNIVDEYGGKIIK
ncbi:hypothetical protein [Clostridium tarantellae]|uniref:Lipoprotein n=1 Tax=Clostridium tarantellae TaxID=39493 RepID=A0A6I1MQQ2_9CLOT|nr:hypothetical protein [Clostridium tarantellae]MPQ44497.1 hypothetical protein [Clostridium tarantellae]